MREIKASQEYCVMLDETKDIKKTEQVSFVFRYYCKGEPKESFLTFKAANRTDADSLFNILIGVLQEAGLDLNQIVAQGYDGAAVMSGNQHGLAALVKQLVPSAVYVHCQNHRLNLVIVDTMKAIPEAGEFFALLQRLYVFVSGSYVHAKWIETQKKCHPNEKPRELQRLIDTRWACRIDACRVVRDRLCTLCQLLLEISEEDNPNRAVDAKGLLLQIDFRFVLVLNICCTLLGLTKASSDFLQNPLADLSQSTELISALKMSLEQMRNDMEEWNKLWMKSRELAETASISTSQKVVPRCRKMPDHLKDYFVLAGTKNCEGDMRTGFFIPAIDIMLAELERRFSVETSHIYNGVASLTPSSEKFLDEENLRQFGGLYGVDDEDLMHEIYSFKRLLQRRKEKGVSRPSSLCECAQFLEPLQEAYFNLFRIAKIALILPVSTAGCERTFSVLKMVKTYARNSMLNDRLSDVAVLCIERDYAIDMDEFVNTFAANHRNRKIKLV